MDKIDRPSGIKQMMLNKRAHRNTVKQIVVPRELWERMRSAIFRISMGREVHAGSAAYDPGLCDKVTVDKLVEDIQRHNAK